MVGFLAIGAIGGIILGFRFRVFVLVPATLFVAGVVAAGGLAAGQQFRVIAVEIALTAALLQVGYIVGCVMGVVLPRHVHGKYDRSTDPYRRSDVGHI